MEFEQLITLIQTVSDSELAGFKYEGDGVKLTMNREKNKVAGAVAAPALPVERKVETENVLQEEKPGKLIKSPLVGTFYTSPSEEAEPFVAAGASVKKGQTIAIVEAMKLMNDIECEFDGTVAEVLAANGEAVEYGQPLFRIV